MQCTCQHTPRCIQQLLTDQCNIMSQRNKLSWWQKLKRLLTSPAPKSVVGNAGPTPNLSESVIDAELNREIGHKQACRKKTADVPNEASNSKHTSTSTPAQKNKSHNQDSTAIVDCLKTYFNDRNWNHTHYRPNNNDGQQSHHLSLRICHKQLNCGYLFRAQEGNRLLAVYGILPFLIPESHQNAAILLITQINYDMLIGNLEMDINDGEIRYKHAIDVEAVGINDDIIEHLIQSVLAMTTVTHELFSDLINNQNPAEDMPSLLADLRQQADSRTFFLPTQAFQ